MTTKYLKAGLAALSLGLAVTLTFWPKRTVDTSHQHWNCMLGIPALSGGGYLLPKVTIWYDPVAAISDFTLWSGLIIMGWLMVLGMRKHLRPLFFASYGLAFLLAFWPTDTLVTMHNGWYHYMGMPEKSSYVILTPHLCFGYKIWCIFEDLGIWTGGVTAFWLLTTGPIIYLRNRHRFFPDSTRY